MYCKLCLLLLSHPPEPVSISITTETTTEDRGVVTVCAVKSSASFNSIRLTVSPEEIAPGVIQLEGGDLLIAQGTSCVYAVPTVH